MGNYGGLRVPVVNHRVEKKKKKAVVVGLARIVRTSKFFLLQNELCCLCELDTS